MKFLNGKRITSFMLTSTLVISLFPISTLQTFASETTENKTQEFLISNADDLYAFAQLVNSGDTTACATLTTDIVVNQDVVNNDGTLNNNGNFKVWTPIGSGYSKETNEHYTFNGVFDGAGYTISGLHGGEGLFSTIDTKGTVKNVNIDDSYFYADSYIGSICAINNGTISNCANTSDIYISSESLFAEIGGICGINNKSALIEKCTNNADISSSYYVGGICSNLSGTINNSVNNGDISALFAGGISANTFDAKVLICSNYGDIEGVASDSYDSPPYAGGITANCNDSYYNSCHNEGNVISSDYSQIGGIIGKSFNTDISYSHNYGELTGGNNCYIGGISSYLYRDTTDEKEYSSVSNCSNSGAVSCGTSSNIGGISGRLYFNVQITDCFNNGTISADNNSDIGGISGNMTETTAIKSSYNIGEISGADNSYVGGINGNVCKSYFNGGNSVIITECYNDGLVQAGNNSYAGGITGASYLYTHISSCHNLGNIKADQASYIGGINGKNYYRSTIKSCYNAGTLSGNKGSLIGGISGVNINSSYIDNTYNSGSVCGNNATVSGICSQNQSTIKNSYNIGQLQYDEKSAAYDICTNIGNSSVIENCYYKVSDETTEETDNYTETHMHKAKDFESGKITYLLNHYKSSGNIVWFQTIGKDVHPVFEGDTVYFGFRYCNSSTKEYSNKKINDSNPGHVYIGGLCEGCHKEADVLIAGDIKLNLLYNGDGMYEGAVTLAEGTYNINISKDNHILGSNYTIDNLTDEPILFSANSDELSKLEAQGGRYTFIFDADTNMLTISFTPTESLVSLFNEETGLYIPLEQTSDNIFTGLLKHDKGTIDFRINDGGVTKCFGYTFSDNFLQVTYNPNWKSATTFKMSGGIYSIKYDRTTSNLAITRAVINPEKVQIFGDVDLDLKKETDNIYTGSIFMNQGTYALRIQEFGTVMCNGKEFTNTAEDTKYSKNWTKPTILNATGGTYTFIYNTQTDKLTISYESATSDKIYIRSESFSDIALTKQGDSDIYVGKINFSAGTYKFRIDEFGTRLCNGSYFSNKVQNIVYRSDWKSDTTLIISGACAGEYYIQYNYATKVLWMIPA